MFHNHNTGITYYKIYIYIFACTLNKIKSNCMYCMCPATKILGNLMFIDYDCIIYKIMCYNGVSNNFYTLKISL